jgi:WD40 repeat protein
MLEFLHIDTKKTKWLTAGAVWLFVGLAGYGNLPALAQTPLPETRLENVSLVKTLTGHSGLVDALAITPDGQTLVSGSWDGTIKLKPLPVPLRAKTGRFLRTFI